jgi:triosephosphate isomerase
LKDFGIPWVILGHSERRSYYGENNQIVGRKCRQALDNGVKVIACFGELLEERQAGETINVVKT